MSRFPETWIAYLVGHCPPDSRVALFLSDVETDTYVLRASCGCPELANASGPLPLVLPRGERGGHIGLVAASQRTNLVAPCTGDPLWPLPATSYDSALVLPWTVPGGPEGVFVFFAAHPREFSDRAVVFAKRMLEFLAHLCGTTMRLHELEHAEMRLSAIAHLAHGQGAGTANSAAANTGVVAALATGTHASQLWNPPTTPSPLSLAQKIAGLSRREQEVLHVFREQRRIAGISRALNISPHTVRNHLKSIFQKLGVHSQVELLAAVGPKVQRENVLADDFEAIDESELENLS